jgi:hypothetical protein
MNIGVDTNLLLRYVQLGKPMQIVARDALAKLKMSGHRLCLFPQVLYEFWVVCTRPIDVNGLGRSAPETFKLLAQFKGMFRVYDDIPSILAEWERLVSTYNVLGKPAHDARIVAAMGVHSVTHLLTFKVSDFLRYPTMTAIDPFAVVAGTAP